ncbi:MAG: hypothetical protein SWO11_18650 [Thermodesulfobacteriota bacterium]|nr:hypothetical protein [Thermodesulfobacteriota bacterium]
MAEATRNANAAEVPGDIKLVERGGADSMYINTSGMGRMKRELSVKKIESGDRIILSGSIGEYEISVLLARKNFHCSPK